MKLWDSIVDVDLRSVFACGPAVYPMMQRCGAGKIIWSKSEQLSGAEAGSVVRRVD